MQTTELWVPPAADADAACWYFIDNNRAYRGPVSKETLRYLYSTKAITGKTYVFAENLGAIERRNVKRSKRHSAKLAQRRRRRTQKAVAGPDGVACVARDGFLAMAWQ